MENACYQATCCIYSVFHGASYRFGNPFLRATVSVRLDRSITIPKLFDVIEEEKKEEEENKKMIFFLCCCCVVVWGVVVLLWDDFLIFFLIF